MDTDPPCTVDYIFYRPGKGMAPDAVKLKYAKVMGDAHDPEDHTIYGSDHLPLVAEFDLKIRESYSLGSGFESAEISQEINKSVKHLQHVHAKV